MRKELLYSLSKKDFRIDYYRASGPGGQKVNKTSSAVRITHIESGAVGQSQDERMQHVNQVKAFERLVKTAIFQVWHKRKCYELLDKETLEEQVIKLMKPKNLKVEVFKNNKWERLTKDET